jgi:RNA polymerase sigma factor (sigma-70 family)
VERNKEKLKIERALLATIRKGDLRPWAQLYDMYAAPIYNRVLMPRLANPAAAEDALSETFRTAIERLDLYQDHPAGIFPWLCRIAHNKAMDLHRARSVTGRKIFDLSQLLAPLMDDIPGADEILELKVDERTIAHRMSVCLESLNPRYKRALELRFFEDKPREDCAHLLEVKVATFDVILLRALRAFKKAWTEVEAPDG